jgi:ankyrin repeat protein
VLIDNGAFIIEYTIEYRSPLYIAQLYGHKEIMDLLLLNGAESIMEPVETSSDPYPNIRYNESYV